MRDINNNQVSAVRDLWVRGIAAAKSGDYADARRYLLRVLDEPNCHFLDHSQQVKAWYWLGESAQNPDEKRQYFEAVLSAEPYHPEALRSLAVLDGRLNPQDIINPDHLPSSLPAISQTPDARQLVCPQCGGNLAYTPDGQALVCERCSGRRGIAAQKPHLAAQSENQDFVIALATLQGHVRPSGQHDLSCPACGAPLMPDQHALSVTCPYCASVFVVEGTEQKIFIHPQAVIPFVLSRHQALKALRSWFKAQRPKERVRLLDLRGFYLPTWLFMIVLPRYATGYSETIGYGMESLQGGVPILTPASRALPEEWADEVNHFELDQLSAYDPSYLAAWPAGTYQISLSDASLAARWLALKKVWPAQGREGDLKNSMDLVIEAYRLVLLPFWAARYRTGETVGEVFMNGQTGHVCGKSNPGGFLEQMKHILGLNEDDKRGT